MHRIQALQGLANVLHFISGGLLPLRHHQDTIHLHEPT